MKQTRLDSFVEAIVGTVIGFGLAMIGQAIFFWAYHIAIPLETNAKLVAWMTLISIVRSFYLRRFFECHYHRIKVWLTTLCR